MSYCPHCSHELKSSHGLKSIVDIAVANPEFSTLVALLKKAGLVSVLQKATNLTVFAPTNDAFAKLDKELVNYLISYEGIDQLHDILLYHVVGNKITSDMIKGAATPKTLQGKNLCVFPKDGTVYINDGKVIKADIMASNGVIHVIDTVLTPLDDCERF